MNDTWRLCEYDGGLVDALVFEEGEILPTDASRKYLGAEVSVIKQSSGLSIARGNFSRSDGS